VSCGRAILLVALTASTIAVPGERPRFLTPQEIINLVDKSEVPYAITIYDDPESVPIHPHPALAKAGSQEPLPFPQIVKSPDGGRSLQNYPLTDSTLRALERAEPLFESSRFDEALRIYLVAAEMDPDCYVLHRQIGDCHGLTGRPGAALGYYDRSIQLNPVDFRSHASQAIALLDLGRTGEARDAFAQALALSPQNPEILRVIRPSQDELGIDLHDQPFTPRASAREEGDQIAIFTAEPAPWLVYGLCKAIWIGEDSHREKFTGGKDHRWTTTEEQSCLRALLASYSRLRKSEGVEADPEIDRMLRIFEDGMLQSFILYEMGSKTSPHFIILLGEDIHDDLVEYVKRYVFGGIASLRE
jgi:tetratricopeptide (TPR) repeat protein